MFCQLQNYKKEHGHVWVPRKYPQNQELSNWLQNQRYRSLNEDSSTKLKCAATRERRRNQLKSLGVAFPDEEQSKEDDWQEKFSELENFKKDHGHVRVPVNYPPNQPLSVWLISQRNARLNENSSAKMKCAATRERRRRQLQSLGVMFPDVEAMGLKQSKEDGWQDMFHQLESFKEEHGHVRVPNIYPPNQQLSNWMQNQRRGYLNENSSSKLKCDATREQRRQKLQSLGVTFPFPNVQQPERVLRESEAEYTPEISFTELKPFQEAYRYGHVIVPVVNSSLHFRKRTAPDDDPSSTVSKKMRIDVFEC
jgi:hypothetical protein